MKSPLKWGWGVVALQEELFRTAMQQALRLKDEKHFRKAYILPALDSSQV